MTHARDARCWAGQLDELVTRIAPRFNRIEPRRRARAYLQGLLAPLERKNGWHLAEAAGDASPDGVQDFLSRMHWDADAVRDDLRAYVVEHLGDPEAAVGGRVAAVLKKGPKPAGGQPPGRRAGGVVHGGGGLGGGRRSPRLAGGTGRALRAGRCGGSPPLGGGPSGAG